MKGINAFTNAEELYHALSLSTDDYIYFCDMKANRFYFPQAMVDEFVLPGRVVDDAAVLWGSRIHENERADFFRDFQSMLDGEMNCHNQEYRAKNKDGEWMWLSSDVGDIYSGMTRVSPLCLRELSPISERKEE